MLTMVMTIVQCLSKTSQGPSEYYCGVLQHQPVTNFQVQTMVCEQPQTTSCVWRWILGLFWMPSTMASQYKQIKYLGLHASLSLAAVSILLPTLQVIRQADKCKSSILAFPKGVCIVRHGKCQLQLCWAVHHLRVCFRLLETQLEPTADAFCNSKVVAALQALW